MACHLCGGPPVGQCRTCLRFYCRSHGDRVCAACSAVTTAPRRPVTFTTAPLPQRAECAFCFGLAAGLCGGCGRCFCPAHSRRRSCGECDDVATARLSLLVLASALGVAGLLLGARPGDFFYKMLAAALALVSALCFVRALTAR
jgi:hypothetical protein